MEVYLIIGNVPNYFKNVSVNKCYFKRVKVILKSNSFEMSYFAENVNIVKHQDKVSGSGKISDYQDKEIRIKIT